MESFLKDSSVHPALPHALPFRVMLEEHLRRRKNDLLHNAEWVLSQIEPPVAGATTFEKLRSAIQQQEGAYGELANASRAIENGTCHTTLDALTALCKQKDAPLKQLLHLMDSSAVCLSGGGIRSATFSLGILEGLARFSQPTAAVPAKSLMHSLDYLSTVSGGGYMGSWMMAWIYRRMKQMGSSEWREAYTEVIAGLAGHSPVTAGDPEAQPIRRLRSYTSFLAPDLGLTLDTFTLGAIILRNIVVNWTMLIPVLFVLISAARTSGFLMTWAHQFSSDILTEPILPGLRWDHFSITWGGVGIIFPFGLAALFAGLALPSHNPVKPGKAVQGAWTTHAFLGCVTVGCWLIAVLSTTTPGTDILIAKFITSVFGFGLMGIAIRKAYLRHQPQRKAATTFAVIVATLTMAAATSTLLVLMQKDIFSVLLTPKRPFWVYHGADQQLFVIFALPLVMCCLMVTTTIFCAILGVFEAEEDREWWVRCGGWFLGFQLAWMLAHAAAQYGRGATTYLIAGASGLLLGLGSSALGYSGATSGGKSPVNTSQLSGVGKFLMKHNLVLPVVGGVAILLISLGMVSIEEIARHGVSTFFFSGSQQAVYLKNGLSSSCIMLGASLLLAVLVNLGININLFSLHGMYRMRLMRAFLGASNEFRRPNAFTGFDPDDTPHEKDMPCAPDVPMHLLNATLNLTGTKNAAWRQRKAEGFSFSPVCCGGWRVGYVPTEIYGGDSGLTLATAMAISGAAANPNMGYQTSPVLSLLMTFFNLRLGCWMPNPARPTPKLGWAGASGAAFFRKPGPSFALRPLIAEAIGNADDKYRWIELTDGGHFENLALYEMVSRRVKHIVLVDAGADPKCQFEDLGNAIRKIEIDLGIPIEFEPNLKMKSGPHKTNSYCAVAKIRYDCVDPRPASNAYECKNAGGIVDDPMWGHLVYIKAGLTGDEPGDILQYSRTHPSFPHETTADQFFTESQFESYRHLGSYVVQQVVGTPVPAGVAGMKEFCELAAKYWSNRPV